MDGGPRGAGTTSRARQTGGSRVACPPAVLAVRLSISSRTSPQIAAVYRLRPPLWPEWTLKEPPRLMGAGHTRAWLPEVAPS